MQHWPERSVTEEAADFLEIGDVEAGFFLRLAGHALLGRLTVFDDPSWEGGIGVSGIGGVDDDDGVAGLRNDKGPDPIVFRR